MSKVAVTLNGREFTIGCEDGQEAYLRELARTLDVRVQSIAQQVGQIGDLRLLLMASLMLVDEQKDASRQIEALEAQVERLRNDRGQDASIQAAERERLASGITALAERLERLAERLEGAETAAEADDETASKSLFAEAGA
jgi:cell division protein ZapA